MVGYLQRMRPPEFCSMSDVVPGRNRQLLIFIFSCDIDKLFKHVKVVKSVSVFDLFSLSIRVIFSMKVSIDSICVIMCNIFMMHFIQSMAKGCLP